MKTIVIVENEAVELESLVNLFTQWQEKINVLTATEQQAAINLLSEQQVDLLVCDLAIPTIGGLDDLSVLTHTFPYVPCIALSEGKIPQHDAIQRGASQFLEKPIDTNQLLSHASELLEVSTSGTVRGIPIHSFVQMLESEEKTCTLEVQHHQDSGLMYIRDGVLIEAETRNLRGEKAARLIFSWREPVVRMRYFNGQRKRQIHKPLISIILEAHKLLEAMEQEKQKRSSRSHQLPLKHLSTLGMSLPLSIGQKLKLEFPQVASLFDVDMVGMVEDQYIILTNPKPYADMNVLVNQAQRVIIKYLHEGRAWMFKAQLLKSQESPSALLFFEYPTVIHYHELRQSKRQSIFIPCTFHFGDKDRFGTLIDLSMTGGLCKIKRKSSDCSVSVAIEEKVALRCLLPGVKEEQKIKGQVRNMKLTDTDTRVGIEFDPLSPNLRDTLGQYLYSLDLAD